MDEVLVSISCITFNHEKYIRDAIEGFLMQKTSFKFEILIHDDASTDDTASIIRGYEMQYPDLIRPFYQEKNQYSNGVKRIHIIFNIPRARGKYIAICEGDDYWTDPFKLEKQVEYMERNPECSMCFHAAEFVNVDKKPTGTCARISSSNQIVPVEDILKKATPDFIPTASRLYRKEFILNPPKWYYDCSVGDFAQGLLLASKGYFYYIDETMSAYRTGVPGSWTSKNIKGKNCVTGNIYIMKDAINTLKEFSKYTDGKYFWEVEQAIFDREISILIFERKLKELKKGKYKGYYDSLSFKSKLKLRLKCVSPRMYIRILKLKKIFRAFLKLVKERGGILTWSTAPLKAKL